MDRAIVDFTKAIDLNPDNADGLSIITGWLATKKVIMDGPSETSPKR